MPDSFPRTDLSRLALRAVLALGLMAGLAGGLHAQAGPDRGRLEVEGAAFWQLRNDVRVPGDTGTLIALDELIGSGPYPAVRFYFTYSLAEKHQLRVLVAPLSVSGDGRLETPVDFAGTRFEPGDVDATYRFNSYRLTYRYRFYGGDRWRWWVGFTGKIRDAKIRLEQDGLAAEKTDVGFVPLLHVAGECQLAERWLFSADLDGLAAPQGRAFDLALKLSYDLSKNWTIAGGYRMVEGGADNEEVYTFAWLNYAVVSLAYRF